MFVDSHAHLFDDRIDLNQVDLANVDKILVPSYKMEHLGKVIQFCKTNSKFYPAIGVHPEYVADFNKDVFTNFVASNLKDIYAIGEIGLDTNYPNYLAQKDLFKFQLTIAKKYNLPVSVHLRGEVFSDFFATIKDFNQKCVLHCFSGNERELSTALDLGCYISFATNITYKGNVALRKISSMVPDDRLLIETDSPSMPPSGMRGKVNTSQNILLVAETLAKVRGKTIEQIGLITSKNANEVFFKDKL